MLGGTTNHTVFLPDNNALAAAGVDITPDHIHYHICPGTHFTNNLNYSSFLPTLLTNSSLVNLGPGKAQVLNVVLGYEIEVYHGQLARDADGALTWSYGIVSNADNFATNGVLHIVDSFLYYPNKTLSQLTEAYSAELSTYRAGLVSQNLVNTVDNTADIMVFVPENLGWRDIDYTPVATLLGQVMRNSLVRGAVYDSDFYEGLTFTTEAGETLTVEMVFAKSEDGARARAMYYILSQDGWTYSEVLFEDVLLPNGVAYIIDTVLTVAPKPSLSVLQNMYLIPEMYKMLSVLQMPAYSAELARLASGNVTLLAPMNEADWSYVDSANVAATKALLQYHMIPNVVLAPLSLRPDSQANEYLTALYSEGVQSQQRLMIKADDRGNVWMQYGIPGGVLAAAYLIDPASPVTSVNGVIYQIDQVLAPPANSTTVLDQAGASLFSEFLRKAQLTDEVNIATNLTMLVPTNAFLQQFCQREPIVCNNNTGLEGLILMTQWFSGDPAALYTTNLAPNERYSDLGLGKLWQADFRNGAWRFGSSVSIVTDNLLTTNGVIHVVDGLLYFTTPDLPAEGDTGLSAGSVVAIVAGVIVLLVLLYFLCKTLGTKRRTVDYTASDYQGPIHDGRGNKGTYGSATR